MAKSCASTWSQGHVAQILEPLLFADDALLFKCARPQSEDVACLANRDVNGFDGAWPIIYRRPCRTFRVPACYNVVGATASG